MKTTPANSGLLALLIAVAGSIAQAQSGPVPPRAEEAFTSENAIADTTIPFAIGASEARQSLRGAFGWPTFQEGLVEGVYFRFDPDGYARFSPNPRLDVDVFEVVCKSRTNECMGRKGGLSVLLTHTGQLQLKLDDAMQGDSFFLSEGISEIQVPERVLMPLDSQMETLLGTATEIVVRRGGEEVSRYSLRGFVATSSYLRWIRHGQDYSVLPRNWPVPNARSQAEATITAQSEWNSPMPRPQVLAVAQPVPGVTANFSQTEVKEQARSIQNLEADLEAVRDTLEQIAKNSANPPPTDIGVTDSSEASEVGQLQEFVSQLASELERLSRPAHATEVSENPQFQDTKMGLIPDSVPAPTQATNLHEPPQEPTPASHLKYLIEDLGLDLRTAVAVLEVAGDGADIAPRDVVAGEAEHALVEELLRGLDRPEDANDEEAQVDTIKEIDPEENVDSSPAAVVSPSEFMLLSYYFRSVALPQLGLQE